MRAIMKGLLFITHQTSRYDYLQSAEIALKGGCRRIQLRMKNATADEVERTGREIKAACDIYDAALYIDDHVEVCGKLNATGVHLGKTDMPPARARKMLGDGFTIGGTANSLNDIMYLVREGVDYIGLGPFRFTTTKQQLSPLLGLSGYRNIVRECSDRGIDLPILAIGGITANDIPEIMETGISGIALSSTILNADDPVAETQKIIEIINSYAI